MNTDRMKEWSHPDVIRKLILSGIPADTLDIYHDTALLRAIRIHNIELVRFILGTGGDPERHNKDGFSPIHVAAINGEPDIVKLLVDAGAKFWTTLHEAIFWGRTEEIEDLYNKNRDLSDTIWQKAPLIFYAIGGNQLKVVQWLVSQGVDIEEVNSYGNTPITCCAWSGRIEIAKWLHQQGASLRPRLRTGYTALLWSSLHGKLPFVKWLLENGVPLSDSLNDGRTAILLAASEGHLATVDWLLGNGSKISECNHDLEDVLLTAARSGYLNVVEYALNHGASITARNRYKFSALLLATREGHYEVVKWLTQFTEDLLNDSPELSLVDPQLLPSHFWKDTNNQNQNALFIATKEGHEDLVDWFLSTDKFNLKQTFGKGMMLKTVLDCAARKGYIEIVRLFLNTKKFDEEEITRAIQNIGKRNFMKKNYKSILLCLRYWLEWPQLRLLWIGNEDDNSPLRLLPREVISLITSLIKEQSILI